MFKDVPSQFDFPAEEKRILKFWEENKIYEKSLKQREGGKPFVFFEGPPTANGMPHPGHALTRAMKDLFPRYRTMTGHYCLRKGGWDTHGLPVEVEVCKELGIHTKEEIEAYGVEKFNRKCLESVFRYTKEWEEMTKRLGFWVNLEEAYVTYHQPFVESVWWSLKQLFDAGLLYQGYKIVWWWAQGGTALSSGEVGQGYREVDDPSVFVRFPLVEDERFKSVFKSESRVSLLVWTTTPWTLPSNMFAAVHPEIDYAVVHDEKTGERLILAAALVEAIRKKAKGESWAIERTIKGKSLCGLRYLPPFRNCYYDTQTKGVRPGQRPGSVDLGVDVTWGEAMGSLATAHSSQTSLVDGREQTSRSEYVETARNLDYLMWRIVEAGFVTLDSGTGLVHEAPAFGEVDFDLWKNENSRFSQMMALGDTPKGIPLFNAVAPNGKFTDEAPAYCRGRWVKECDKDIIRDLKEREAYPGSKIPILLHQEQYRHDYPFCWRAEQDPLIQYPRRSWFIKTTQFKDEMLANNQRINWLPEHIKEGRFGKFLESNVDWSLSRERYWGTPLPIWVCQSCGHMDAVDSYAALKEKKNVSGFEVWEQAKAKEPNLSDHLRIHKPYIDAIQYDCPKCAAARMKRVPEVIDCWYDSGAMPFAQWGYPHTEASRSNLSAQFPADFISEALDQTRGWFYSLVAISTMLFGKKGVASGPLSVAGKGHDATALTTDNRQLATAYPLPFRNCIVLGLLLGEDGLKMSKSKKNYKEPTYIFDKEGADAMRWLFFSGQAPWTSIRFQESAIAEGQREFLIRLFNVYSFFVIYANIDKWTPGEKGTKSELDRWITSELHRTIRDVRAAMDAYDNFTAAKALITFVDALSNWYVRRGRDRYWRTGMDADKTAAYQTLWEVLVATTTLIAPFTPFFAESLYQNLVRSNDANAPASVHLRDYPAADTSLIDETLSAEMAVVRDIVSLGRAARADAKMKVRQPLALAEIVLADKSHTRWLSGHEALIRDELNVQRIEFTAEADHYVNYQVKPNFKTIGPKFGKLGNAIKAALAGAKDPAAMRKSLDETGRVSLTVDGQSVELTPEDVQIELTAKPGWAAAQGRTAVVVLKTEITDELRDEGAAREIVHHIQQKRKDLDLKYEQRIDLAVVGDSDILRVVKRSAEYIMSETLAQSLLSQPLPAIDPVKADIDGHEAAIFVKPV